MLSFVHGLFNLVLSFLRVFFHKTCLGKIYQKRASKMRRLLYVIAHQNKEREKKFTQYRGSFLFFRIRGISINAGFSDLRQRITGVLFLL